jgi:hypothetical protein
MDFDIDDVFLNGDVQFESPESSPSKFISLPAREQEPSTHQDQHQHQHQHQQQAQQQAQAQQAQPQQQAQQGEFSFARLGLLRKREIIEELTKVPDPHAQQIEQLNIRHAKSFDVWLEYLSKGFNLLFYG